MISLFLAIIFASGMYIVFKIASLYNLKPFPIILINYFTCVILSGIIWHDQFADYFEITKYSTFVVTTLTGMVFIGSFYLMAVATGLIGIASATTISRMSMIFPTLVTVLIFNEPFNWINGVGFLISLVVIYLIVIKGNQTTDTTTQQKDNKGKFKSIQMALAMFVGFGLCDIMNKSITRVCFDGHFHPLVMFFIYSGALMTAIVISISQLIRNQNAFRSDFKIRTLPLGLFLGVINLGALYFFLNALIDKSLGGASVFSINSVGILTFSTLISVIFFKDKLNKFKLIGIGLAIFSILLLNWRG